MQKRSAFTDMLLRRFVRANRIPAVHPPRARCLSASNRRWSGSTLKTFVLPRIGFAALLLTLALPVLAGVREVGAIGLTVNDLGRELNFFTNTLPFEVVSISDASGKEQDALLGLSGVRLRIATLKLGDESITLTEHVGKKGRPIPQDSRSFDRWFQHIAIVVSDMDKAYARLLAHKVTHVSTAPQTLPVWNKDAGGIKAFYFRDPEDHGLEIIWFPPGKGNPKWQQPTDRPESGRPLFLGIDHTAIVVSDTDKSLAFYRDQLGFKGGFCGYAASVGEVRLADPLIWSIVDGQIIVQHTKGADELWKKDVAGNKAKADKYWPHLIGAKAGKKDPVDSLLGKSVLNLAKIN